MTIIHLDYTFTVSLSYVNTTRQDVISRLQGVSKLAATSAGCAAEASPNVIHVTV